MLNSIALSASNPAEYGSIGQSAIYAVLGYITVFIGLVLLMAVIAVMGKVMLSRKASKTAPAPAPAPATAKAAVPEPVKTGPTAPGSAGKVVLGEVPDRDAALLMAIVADKMGKPLNELRFKSIKEVK